MNKKIDPEDFNLKSTVILEEIKPGKIAIVINRKSRIIMKDGIKLLEQAKMIWHQKSKVKIVIKTSTPVCSKTKTFLEDNGIGFEN
ncbi:MAG TPA: hypothetical protein PK926_16505 [Spirochaetota bacterium]|nr:hypothetical protein [Spirochaetota bacterium]HPI90667.1 hypothetical protein [Spirochaetota bacterium]HPR49681.1 hypothetical protein [Spirochaetota bacterium]